MLLSNGLRTEYLLNVKCCFDKILNKTFLNISERKYNIDITPVLELITVNFHFCKTNGSALKLR